MRRILSALAMTTLLTFSGCETEEPETICFPQRVKQIISQGTNVTTLTADFKYENDLVDYIIWSNFQTHYYSYNDEGELLKISRKNVQSYQRLESWMIYESGVPSRSNEYKVLLDPFTQFESDTIYTGFRDFDFEGEHLIREDIYLFNLESEKDELTGSKNYEYDLSGNLIKYAWIASSENDTIEAFSYTYDTQKHPYSSLKLVFDGETYINNVTETVDLLSGVVSKHHIIYNPTDFPSQINIKQGSFLTEVITFDYMCQ
jgi:hypothetical protein